MSDGCGEWFELLNSYYSISFEYIINKIIIHKVIL